MFRLGRLLGQKGPGLILLIPFVDKAGAWYSMGEERIGQGKENARQYLKENPAVAQRLEAELREKFVPAEARPGEDDDRDEADA